MSTRSTYAVRGERATYLLSGSFGVNGGAIVDVQGKGFTVSYVAAGKYKVTLDKSFPFLLSAVAGRQAQNPTDQIPGTYAHTSNSFNIYLWDVSAVAVADPGTNVDDRINFTATLKDSAV